MGKIWAAVVVWFQGKKTILGGMLVVAAGVAGVWFGKLDAVNGLTVVGVGLSIAGYSAKVNRHQAQLLAALQDVSRAAADAKLGKAAVISDLEPGVSALAAAAAPALISQAGASLHLTAGTVADLQSILASLVPGAGSTSTATQTGGTAK